MLFGSSNWKTLKIKIKFRGAKFYDFEIVSNNTILKTILNNLRIYINFDGEETVQN